MSLFKQLHLKLLALAIAIILWFIVITVENNVVKYPEALKVSAINIAQNLSLMDSIQTAEIYLKMNREQLKELTNNDIEIFIDFSEKRQGRHSMPIQALVEGSRSKVIRIEPAQIEVELVETHNKEVTLLPQIEGSPKSEYKISEIIVKPEKLKLTGPKSFLDQIETLNINYRLSGNEIEDLTVNVEPRLDAIDGTSNVLNYSPAQIELQIKIEREIIEKEIEIEANFIREEDRKLYAEKIKINPSKVKIKGKKEDLDKINKLKTLAIEVSALIRNKQVKTGLELPQGVVLAETSQQVTVILE
jgi:YbbR domain-containing protein